MAGYAHFSGNTNPTTAAQGAYIGWNALTGGAGETDFINNQGGGSGGFAFMNTPNAGTPRTTLVTITGGGNVGIGTTTPGYPLDVESQITTSYANYGYLNANGNTGVIGGGGSGLVGVSAHFAGRVESPEFDAISDQREKRVLDHMQPEGALLALSGVDVVKYEWLYRGGHPRWGVLAQQLGPHVPEAVNVGPGVINGVPVEDFHTVDFSQITALELAAIQGLDARTAALSTPVSESVAFEGAVEGGDVVCEEPSHAGPAGLAARCESPDAAVLGVASGGGLAPGSPLAVVSAGRAAVKVSLENGPDPPGRPARGVRPCPASPCAPTGRRGGWASRSRRSTGSDGPHHHPLRIVNTREARVAHYEIARLGGGARRKEGSAHQRPSSLSSLACPSEQRVKAIEAAHPAR